MSDQGPEAEYIRECPACGQRLVGMTPEEFLRAHGAEDCPHAPLGPHALEVASRGPSIGDLLDAAWSIDRPR